MSEDLEKLPDLPVYSEQLSSRLEECTHAYGKSENKDGASDSEECSDTKVSNNPLRRRMAVRIKVSSPDDIEDDNTEDTVPSQVKLTRVSIDESEHRDSGYTRIESIKQLKLHYPKSAEKLMKHLKSGEYDLFQRNQNGETPLHAIVGSGRSDKMECLFLLMVHSEYGTHFIDIPEGRNGDTALHQAVQLEDVETVKVLVAFGANINALNYSRKTPLDILTERGEYTKYDEKYDAMKDLLKLFDAKSGHELPVNQKRGSHERLWSFSADLPELQEEIEVPDFEAVNVDNQHRKSLTLDEFMSSVEIAQKVENYLTEQYKRYYDIWDHDFQVVLGLQQFELQGWKATCSPAIQFQVQGGSRILCLDGGGMRGLIQIEILSELERCTGRKITDLFDWIIGTSTGGIVALGLVYGKKSLAELRQVYFKLKEEIFAKSGFGIGYNTEALERILKETNDCEMRMSAVKEPKVLISAVHKRTTNLNLTFFNNCFNDEYSDELVWKVARYTSAAPMNFSECDDYVDGGVLANNPSEYGLTAIQNYYRHEGIKLDIACVVSVGTGNFPAENLGSTDAHEGIFHLLALKKKATNLMTLISKALVESEDVAKNSQCRCEEQHIPFFRFSPNLDSEVESGETNNDVLIDMLMATRCQIADQWSDQYSDLMLIFSRIEKHNKHVKRRRMKTRRQRHAIRIAKENDNAKHS